MTGNNRNNGDVQRILSDTISRLLADHVSDRVRHEAEQGQFPTTTWQALVEAGLMDVLVFEGASTPTTGWPEASLLMRSAGAFGIPAPFVETIIARWILSSAGLDAPDTPLTIAGLSGAGAGLVLDGTKGSFTVSGTLSRVPWGRDAEAVVTVVIKEGVPYAVCAPVAQSHVTHSVNLAREPRDNLSFDKAPVMAAATRLMPDSVMMAGALARAGQMAGALDRVVALTVRYARDRVQFGRPIAAFQAIQQALAVLSTQAAAADMAAEQAAQAMHLAEESDAIFAVAVAKTRADDATGIGAGMAHQIHGAIGFTYEHELQFSTRRLWSWRTEFGSGQYWAARLGRAALDHGGDALWPWLVAHKTVGIDELKERNYESV
ncbi:MAG: acyl-CoA dehydrogenase [Parvularculales bacterium]